MMGDSGFDCEECEDTGFVCVDCGWPCEDGEDACPICGGWPVECDGCGD